MEKFFVVKEGSSLYEDFWKWRNGVSENNKIVISFFGKHNIEAAQYYISKDTLGIVPTENDFASFETQFKKYSTDEGLYLFKKNSVIGKAWIQQAAEMKIYHKPFPTWYIKQFVGRSTTRLFDHNGIVYCSISADQVDFQSDTFEEIKGSEFFKIVEEIEEKMKA